MSVLRSVSPIHLEYLRNMGVRSSMSISILRGGRLWGLIACHHGMPNHVGFQRRSVAELFGQMFSYLLEVRSREEERLHDEQARDIHHRIASAFAAPNASLTQVPETLASMSGYIAADGIATYQGGEITLTGVTPTKEEFLQIVRFLNKTAAGRVYATHCLKDVFPPAADFAMRAAGLLSVPISRIPRDYLVFFRREVVRTVTWAGDPDQGRDARPEWHPAHAAQKLRGMAGNRARSVGALEPAGPTRGGSAADHPGRIGSAHHRHGPGGTHGRGAAE